MNKGLILAAGTGSRLRPATNRIPKPLLPIANKPTIHYTIEMMREAGVDDICVVTGHLAELLEDALGDGSQLGVRLSYVRQDEPKGLAHAVGCAADFVSRDPFLLMLGDTMYDMSLAPLVQGFESDCLSLVAPVTDPSRYGIAVMNGAHIVQLEEKPKEPKSNLAMAGVYLFGPALWDVLPDLRPSARGELEITDAIQMLVDRTGGVHGEVFEGWWHDTGTLDLFLESNRYWMTRAGVSSALLGEGASLPGARAEEFSAVGDFAEVRNGTLLDSIVLPGVRLDLNGGVLRSSLVGSDATLEPGQRLADAILG